MCQLELLCFFSLPSSLVITCAFFIFACFNGCSEFFSHWRCNVKQSFSRHGHLGQLWQIKAAKPLVQQKLKDLNLLNLIMWSWSSQRGKHWFSFGFSPGWCKSPAVDREIFPAYDWKTNFMYCNIDHTDRSLRLPVLIVFTFINQTVNGLKYVKTDLRFPIKNENFCFLQGLEFMFIASTPRGRHSEERSILVGWLACRRQGRKRLDQSDDNRISLDSVETRKWCKEPAAARATRNAGVGSVKANTRCPNQIYS